MLSKLGIYLVLKRIWNPIDFQGQRSRSPGQIVETIQYALCHRKFSYMIIQKFVKLCTLQDPNMKMCTSVRYPSPLSFTPVMLLLTLSFSKVKPVWTWKFETIRHALCHHNSSHMLNEMFVKLSILREPNMKMCTLVVILVHWVFPELCPFGLGNLIQFTVHFVITTPPTCLMRCLWNLVYYKILIWRCGH
jgi:hypothetical protein